MLCRQVELLRASQERLAQGSSVLNKELSLTFVLFRMVFFRDSVQFSLQVCQLYIYKSNITYNNLFHAILNATGPRYNVSELLKKITNIFIEMNSQSYFFNLDAPHYCSGDQRSSQGQLGAPCAGQQGGANKPFSFGKGIQMQGQGSTLNIIPS